MMEVIEAAVVLWGTNLELIELCRLCEASRGGTLRGPISARGEIMRNVNAKLTIAKISVNAEIGLVTMLSLSGASIRNGGSDQVVANK